MQGEYPFARERFRVEYILPPTEAGAAAGSDEEEQAQFLRQLRIQRQNEDAIRAEARCGADGLEQRFREDFPCEATIVAWQLQNIRWGRWDGDALHLSDGSALDPADVLELRLFNEAAELRLSRQDGEFVGRLARDDGSQWRLHVDTFSPLFGKNTFQGEDGFVRLRDEGRRMDYAVPCERADAAHYGLLTRNYVAEVGEAGQLGYADYRFVAIRPID